jgi:hypothetical protein
MSFMTLPQPPAATTQAASSISATSAQLNSYVNPNGGNTTVYFQYGLTTSYGSSTTSASIGTTAGNYGAAISNLSPSTGYHFRVVAYNSGGTNYGSDMSFTTSARPSIVLHVMSEQIVGPATVLTLSWTNSGNWKWLEGVETLTGNWGTVSTSWTTNGNWVSAIVTNTAPSQFYRLRGIEGTPLGSGAPSFSSWLRPPPTPGRGAASSGRNR